MRDVIQWLLGLEHIRLGRDAPIVFQWQHEPRAWLLFCAAVVGGACVALVYRRERVSTTRRVVLALLRCGMLALVVAVICQPALVLRQDRIEPSHVAVLVDTSRSMAARDEPTAPDNAPRPKPAASIGAAGLTQEEIGPRPRAEDTARADTADETERVTDVGAPVRPSRIERAREALLGNDAAVLRQLLGRHAVQLYGFAGGTEALAYAGSVDDLPALVDALGTLVADGASTDLDGALAHVIRHGEGRRLAGIVLATDGRSTQVGAARASAGLHDVLDLARGRKIPIFPIRIGSTTVPPDIEVGPLRADEQVFVHDILAVEADVAGRGLVDAAEVTVTLTDERTGLPVASKTMTLTPAEPETTVELRTKPSQSGRVRYRVEATPIARERVRSNNVDRIDVNVLDDRVAVLYVELYPRYEYRYLKNALLREETVALSVLLLEADEAFVQEGTYPIRRFPETPEELDRFDVVVFGDVDPRGGWLTPAQMKMLLAFVGDRGGGFALIAGERYAPHRYRGTPLEKLIPVRIDPAFMGRYEATIVTSFRPRLTWEGRHSRIYRFAADEAESAAMFEALPDLYWVARTLGPKPGATLLAEHPTMRTTTGRLPLVVIGRYGAGKIFFQATDETWRWRRHTGELLYDTYWVRVVRELMRSQRVGRDHRYVIRTDRRRYAYGQPVRTQVEFDDSQLLAQQGDVVAIAVRDDGAALVGRIDAQRVAPDAALFEAVYVPPRAGSFELKAADITPRTGDRPVSALIHVRRADLESRRPEADHATLERIADVTDAVVVDPEDVSEVLAGIRDRSARIPDDVTEPIWDSKLVLGLFVLMISMEWVLRKAFGLV
ncbi:MAG: hypothetical protein ACE5E6_00085 [Phycisphaerae bacterium]